MIDDNADERASSAAPTTAAELPAERKAALLSGRNFWETEAIPELGLPSVVLADGTYGLRHQAGQHDHIALFESTPATCFPPGVAVGSSWDRRVAQRLGAALGREARAQGVDIVLGPGVNIKRSPLCGRNFEYYSEDPLVSGVLGAAFTRALQSEGPGVSVKHFAANNQETHRQTVSADVDERTLREIYLSAFERVVRDGEPATVMASYNRINGVFASENRWLLTNVLREEWGFDGVVVSDWNAVTDRVAALRAGLDLEMPGGTGAHDDDVTGALATGELTSEDLDASVTRVAALARYASSDRPSVDLDGHHLLAQELASECAVLLRNERGALPIPDGKQVAVIGAFAQAPRYQGGGSAHVNATRVDSPLEALRDLTIEQGIAISSAEGFSLDGTGDDEGLLAEALDVARHSDIAVVFAGLDEASESEGFDRGSLELPAQQVRLITEVAAVAQRTVVVLANGGVVSLEPWHDHVDAILEGFLLGQGGGVAIAQILLGRVNPSGHLAETIPLRLQDHPSSLNFPGEQGHVRYGEGVMVGYRYFSTFQTPVRYPFGHGLSYTSFTTGEPRVEGSLEDGFVVTVEVTNTGHRAGKHVVQVYVTTEAGPVVRPVRELRGFDKIELQAGETRSVSIELPRRAFSYWDIKHQRWLVAPGNYSIEIATDALTVLHSAPIALDGDRVIVPATMDTPLSTWFDHPLVGTRVKEVLGLGAVEVSPEHLAMMASMTMRQFVAISGLPYATTALEELISASAPA